MDNDEDSLATSLLDGVKRIDDFRASVETAENGTDIEAAWSLIDDMRETLSKALHSLGIEVAPYDVDHSAQCPR